MIWPQCLQPTIGSLTRPLECTIMTRSGPGNRGDPKSASRVTWTVFVTSLLFPIVIRSSQHPRITLSSYGICRKLKASSQCLCAILLKLQCAHQMTNVVVSNPKCHRGVIFDSLPMSTLRGHTSDVLTVVCDSTGNTIYSGGLDTIISENFFCCCRLQL